MDMLARNWGWIALRGVAGILFGLLVLFNPVIGLALLLVFFGAYALVDGLATAIAAVANRRGEPHWVALLISGLLGILIGIVTFVWPGVTAIALLYLIAAWAAIIGIGEIAAAIRLRKAITGEWLLLLAGVVSVVFGIVLVLSPAAGVLAMALWIGAFAIVLGILRLVLAFRLRGWQKAHPGAAA
ncbi:MAG TPA: DUF308 domain-containing protein [Longimicrobiales bacterium]